MLGAGHFYQSDEAVRAAANYSTAKLKLSGSQRLLQLKVMSGDDSNLVRTVGLPVTIGRPTGASGIAAAPSNALFNSSLISRRHALINEEQGQVRPWLPARATPRRWL